jgi:CRISPR/Cas system CSM-associated protein Csm3 (group 7 of RAMP superfamily)
MDVLCYKITAILTAETPLHVGSGQRTGVIKRSFGHVPGSTLRGAVGTSLIKSVCKLDRPIVKHEECKYFEECAYANLFGEEFGKASSVFFRYAYPLHLKCGGVYTPAPKTFYVCKNPQCRKSYDRISPPKKCDCGEDIELFHGFLCNQCHEISEHPVAFSRTTSTALDRNMVSAAKVGSDEEKFGTLHTTETIRRGSKFAVDVLVSRNSADHVDPLKATMERGVQDEGIGGGKSRGLGKVKIEDLKVEEVTEDVVRKKVAEIDVSCFSIRLVSPMLLDGHALDGKSLLEGCRRSYTWLFHKGKPSLQNVELKASRVESESFSGWSLKTQKRRRIEPAISAGSVFQFESEQKDETLALGLAALEFHAIGSYKPHGCGQVTIEPSR